jgi:hypothetical protein
MLVLVGRRGGHGKVAEGREIRSSGVSENFFEGEVKTHTGNPEPVFEAPN